MVVHALKRQRKENLRELAANPVYVATSRTTRATKTKAERTILERRQTRKRRREEG